MSAREESFAADAPPTRKAEILIAYTEYTWWLMRWADNQLLCQLIIDHEGWPGAEDVANGCETAVYQEWQSTPPCAQENTSACEGVYLYLLNQSPAEKTVVVDLPPSQVWISLTGCTPTSLENLCPELPSLLLRGDEPLPNESITTIHAIYNQQVIDCAANTCIIPLNPTPIEGNVIEFWADSTFGDTSQHFTARIRVVDSGASESPIGGGWYVDIISNQWRGNQVASCADVWRVFPPVGGPPAWLTTPESPTLLASEEPYYFLAGRLISQGLVDASGCNGGGLLTNDYANACGLELARPLVDEWQNRFDATIIQAAQETNIPGQLMKNLFAQESQFWPGIFKDTKEFGLGQITENGAEPVLLWNQTFYNQFCPLVLNETRCEVGYSQLSTDEKATLRGALALKAKADCADCPMGIDLTHADFSIKLFAETIRANCEQVAQIVYNASGKLGGEVSSYEDLWRLTVANYHAGAGCVSYAVHSAYNNNQPLVWSNISPYFTPPCQGVISYVEKITR